MRKPLVGALAAVTFGGAVAASATPASADSWRRHRDRDNDAAAAAIVAGVAGLAIGAALAGNSRDRGYYNRGYYQDPYYGRGYYGTGYRAPYAYAPAYGYRTCTMKERVRDPYTGRRMTITRRYAC
ncbi:MAG: hypothetical protein WCY15_00200 [Phenylobacterium sp.]|uniref:hypothetical protein n=1 Tax=Phenylobacterium sp. TaxID=1871053 RepID=UPI002A323C48|nr:hypothetical protein [Phenylobacterium sp.]MDD3837703.1 hypothetical protein [Phenylobacterium sp.]MDX9997388.1 hypothetical protein [Phenylobacterium sp.]